MKYIKYLVFISIVVLFSACRPEPLEIDIPRLDPQVVVFSQVIPSALMTVALTQTIDALDFNEEEGDSLSQGILDALLVSNATVTIGYRDQVDTLFPVTNGLYASVGTPSFLNETYTLNILTEDGRALSAENTMLPIVAFNEATPVIERSSEDTLVKFDFRIVDAPGDNWYMINFYSNGEEEEEGIDLNSFFQSGSNVLKKTELLSDIAFEGNVFEGTIDLPNVSPMDSIVVTLSNINEDYYNYLEIRQSSTNLFTEITKEPVSLPTNIEGGLGFFNTHFPDAVYFDLNEF